MSRKTVGLKAVKQIILIVLALLVLSFLFMFVFAKINEERKARARKKDIPLIELPPYSITNVPEWLYTVSDGQKIGFNERTNDIEFTDKITGEKYIYKDGNIYKVDKDEGTLSLVTNKDEYDRLLKLLKELLEKVSDLNFKRTVINNYKELDTGKLQEDRFEDAFIDKNTGERFVYRDGNLYKVLDDGTLSLVRDNNKKTNDEDVLQNRVFSSNQEMFSNVPNTKPVQVAPPSSLSTDSNVITLPDGTVLTKKNAATMIPTPSIAAADGAKAILDASNEYKTQNGQDEKRNFVNSQRDVQITTEWLTQNHIAQGSIIPIILINGVNSDLPGEIIGEVSQNIYDSLTGKNLLIPKGTRVIATYDSAVTYGQTRLLVVWNYLVRPDGFAMNLPGFTGTNKLGYSGVEGAVDAHIGSIVGGAALSSVIDIGLGVATSLVNDSIFKNGVASVANTVASTGQKYLDKQINRQPTIVISPGTYASLLVSKNLKLENYKGAIL